MMELSAFVLATATPALEDPMAAEIFELKLKFLVVASGYTS
jgi:hypothetical protein